MSGARKFDLSEGQLNCLVSLAMKEYSKSRFGLGGGGKQFGFTGDFDML